MVVVRASGLSDYKLTLSNALSVSQYSSLVLFIFYRYVSKLYLIINSLIILILLNKLIHFRHA